MRTVAVIIGAVYLALVLLSIPASFATGYLIVERHIGHAWQRISAGLAVGLVVLPFMFAAAYLMPITLPFAIALVVMWVALRRSVPEDNES
jgi:hypothetical protein